MNITLIMKGLAAFGILFSSFLMFRGIKTRLQTEEGQANWAFGKKHIVYNTIVGIVANFLDTLGVGSFATSTSAFKIKGSINDEHIPGTLTVGDTIPVLVEAFLFFGFVEIQPLTLVSMIAAQVVGAYVGASVVTKWDANKIRLGMGFGLLVLGIVMTCKQLGLGPFGIVGTATGITGIKLIISVILCFVFGALMNIGIGAYAPTFALTSLMGMNVQSAFPIMMGGCAFLMTFGNGPKFIKEGKYDMVGVLTQAIGGTFGALVAYFLVKSMPVDKLLWLVVAVVFYTSIMFIRDFLKNKNAGSEETEQEAA